MNDSSICGGVAVAVVAVDFDDGAIDILSAISFPTGFPFVSASFWTALLEVAVSVFVADVFVVPRSFCPYFLLRFVPIFFGEG